MQTKSNCCSPENTQKSTNRRSQRTCTPLPPKFAADLFLTPLMKLHSVLLRLEVPMDWKMTIATRKSGSGYKFNNYCIVLLMSLFCKCLDQIFGDQLLLHLGTNNHLTSGHQDSIKNHSRPTDLLMFLDETARRKKKGKKTEVCYLEFSKGFNPVQHFLPYHDAAAFSTTELDRQQVT